MTGRLIALEGGEGVGKSTQARRLAERLEARGVRAVLTREPGGTPGAEAIRNLLLHRAPAGGWGAEAEALLFAAARADHVARRIRPALEAGSWVICDRFLASSLAYQGAAAGLGEDAVRTLHAIGSGGLLPDATLVLTLPDALARERVSRRDGSKTDAIAARSTDFHDAVAQAFARMGRHDPSVHAIDATGDPAAVASRIDAVLRPLLP